MVEAIRPFRGAYIHSFGASWFIMEFLKGHSPHGSLRIDPAKGATQADVHSAYKLALHISIAEDQAARDAEEGIKKGQPLTPEEVEARSNYYLSRIPARLTRMRYHSFVVYFGLLKRLGWVEPTGEEEPSLPQEYDPKFQPRTYYRLTAAGMAEEVPIVFDPIMRLYPDYTPEKRHGPKRLYYRRH